MAITKPRNRVVLFRLTEDEYQFLQNACEAGEARSISDFARTRILGPAHVDGAQRSAIPDTGEEPVRGGEGARSLQKMEARLEQLQSAVAELTKLVSGAPQQKSAAVAMGNGSVRTTPLRDSEHG